MPGELTVNIPYQPNAKQYEFHSLKAKYRGFCGGWGNGKTSGGCAEFFIRLMEFPGTNSIVSRKTRPELRTTTWDMLVNGDTQPTGWRGIPKEVIEVYNRSDLYIRLKNGSQIHGLPLDDPKKLENYNLGLFMIDQAEEVDLEILLKVHGRLRQHDSPREGIFLFNPNGHNYLWERFIDPHREQRWKKLYQCIEATPFDNPNLPEDYLEQFEGLPKHWYDRFVLGSHEVFVGQIFVDYSPEIHAIAPFHIPAHWERWRCIDPGIGHEGAVSWVARDEDNNRYYYREIVEAGHDVSWWADSIEEAELEMDWGGPDEEIGVSLIGAEAMQRSQVDGQTVRTAYEELGIQTELADRDPIGRINYITRDLRPRVGHSDPLGRSDVPVFNRAGDQTGKGAPRLFIFDTCEYTLKWLPQYRWRPVKANFTEEDSPERPRKKDDHTVDNLGHILVAMGDSEPDLPKNSVDKRSMEQREADEHFEQELEVANATRPAYRPGKIATTVG